MSNNNLWQQHHQRLFQANGCFVVPFKKDVSWWGIFLFELSALAAHTIIKEGDENSFLFKHVTVLLATSASCCCLLILD